MSRGNLGEMYFCRLVEFCVTALMDHWTDIPRQVKNKSIETGFVPELIIINSNFTDRNKHLQYISESINSNAPGAEVNKSDISRNNVFSRK